MNKTGIEWVRNPDGTPGYTLNPAFGCSRGCRYCYARRIAYGWKRKHYCEKCVRFEPHLHLERLAQIERQRKPAGIFICSMGELFDPLLPAGGTEKILDALERAPRHRFYLLTKRTTIATMWFPANVWVGVTCDGRDRTFDDTLIDALAKADVQGKRFISFEPLLGRTDVPDCTDWIIIGPQTGPGAVRPEIEWVEHLVEQADARRVPVFYKDKLMVAFPDIAVRQEMPEARGAQATLF